MHLVRKVLPFEIHKYISHLKKLSKTSKYMRFGTLVSDEILDEMGRQIDADSRNHILFAVENFDLEFIGVGHIVLGQPVELAISVSDQHQNQGIGTEILRRMIDFCKMREFDSGMITCLPNNHAVMAMCKSMGIEVDFTAGEATGNLAFPPPDLETSINDAVADQLSLISYWHHRAWLPWRILNHSSTA